MTVEISPLSLAYLLRLSFISSSVWPLLILKHTSRAYMEKQQKATKEIPCALVPSATKRISPRSFIFGVIYLLLQIGLSLIRNLHGPRSEIQHRTD